jgi:hypothetical protein
MLIPLAPILGNSRTRKIHRASQVQYRGERSAAARGSNAPQETHPTPRRGGLQRSAPHQAHRRGRGNCPEHQVAGGQARRGQRRPPGPHPQQAAPGAGHQGQKEHPAYRSAEVYVAAPELPLQCGGYALLLRWIERTDLEANQDFQGG